MLCEAREQEREARKFPPSFDVLPSGFDRFFPPYFDARTSCRQSLPRRAAVYCLLCFGNIGSVPQIRNAPKAYGGTVNFLAPRAQPSHGFPMVSSEFCTNRRSIVRIPNKA
jgi:hypothetical protein